MDGEAQDQSERVRVILDLTQDQSRGQLGLSQLELEFTTLIGIETLTCLTIILTNMIFLIAILK